MFSSLKEWINVPFTYKPFLKRNGAGTKVYGDAVDALCYPVSNVQLVTNTMGAEVTSTTQMYVPGDSPITVKDLVNFEDEERPILRISTYYRNSMPDIKVVYL